jgi:hypothetical protein
MSPVRAAHDDATGYAHPGYVASLSEFGEPLHLPRSDGWLLRRPISGGPYFDAMGPYPLFICREWQQLGDDLSALSDQLVSVVVVTDPFAQFDDGARRAFDTVVPYKDHFVADLSKAPERFVRKSHQVHARRALRSVTVDVCDQPSDHLGDFVELYAKLSRRHAISGLRAFSRQAFEQQLQVPGLVMFRARVADEVVGLDLWYVQGDVAYGHLAAFDDIGYRRRASYATKWAMLHHFRDDPAGEVRWVNLAGSAGSTASPLDGLALFKRGWSTGTRPTYLCERVLQPAVYQSLAGHGSRDGSCYLPAYRAGEFE